LQQQILENSTYGRKVLSQVQEQQTVIKALEEASKKGLTRQRLLELVIDASKSEVQLATLVSMARGGLDYGFFQLLTERIQITSGEDQAHLTELREKLLNMTHEIDEAIKEEEQSANKLLAELLESEDIEEATLKALPAISEIFFEVLRKRIQDARKAGDEDNLEKLQKVAATIQKVSAPGANIELIETLIQSENEQAINDILEEHADEITDEFMQFMMNLLNQTQQQEGRDVTAEKLHQVYRQALRFSMKRNLEAEA